MRISPLAVVAVALCRLGVAQAPPVSVIAVLEHPQCHEPDTIAVRPLFAKNGSEWTPLKNRQSLDRVIPGEMQWTIAFDGRNLGILRTTSSRPAISADWFDRDMLIDLLPVPRWPRIGNVKKQFEGWCAAPPERPLVLVNGANFRDPEGWRPFVPSASLRETLFPAFRRAADSVYICPKDPEKAVLFHYAWRDLKIVAGYRNRIGRTIIAVELDPRAWTCDGMRDPEWDMHWFLLDEQPVLLGRSLELVDAGDYDADGKSELLFWHSADDEDGYTLFAADFQKRVDKWWTYH